MSVQELIAPAGEQAPSFPPVYAAWDRPRRLAGDLVAIRRISTPASLGWGRPGLHGEPAFAHWLGHRKLELVDGESRADLALSPVAEGRLAGAGHADWIRAFYALPVPEARIPLPPEASPAANAFDLEVPDLRGLGGQYCIEGGFGDPRGELSTVTRCGLALGAHAGVFDVKRPPHFARPAEIGTPDMSFAWSSDDWAVYLLKIEPQFPTALNPAVYVYTTAVSATWPDLRRAGVIFPEGAAAYSACIMGLGPYADLDAAVGPEGMGALTPRESRRSASRQSSISIAAPASPQAARPASAAPPCPVDGSTVVVCNQWKTVEDRELYVLSAMNRKLEHYPAFAAAVGSTCVRDCKEARAFVKVYRRFRGEHPDFDANEPTVFVPRPPRP